VDQLLCFTLRGGFEQFGIEHTLCYVPSRVLPYGRAEIPELIERTLDAVVVKPWYPSTMDGDLNWEADGGNQASASMHGAGMALKLWTSCKSGDVWVSIQALERVPGATPAQFCEGKAPDVLLLCDIDLHWSLNTNRFTWGCHGTFIALPVESGIREESRFLNYSAPYNALAAACYAHTRTEPPWTDAAVRRWSLSWGKLKLIRFSPSAWPKVCNVAIPSEASSIQVTVFDAALGLVYLQEDAMEDKPQEVHCLSYA
jgi:hypothetical protein